METGRPHHRLRMSSKLTTQEAVMGQVIPKQHPAVVLRSHFKAVRALLVAALIAICALAAALVIVANDDNDSATTAQPAVQEQALPSGTRFDGGPDEGTRGPQAYPAAPGTRFDGGPDEGTRGPQGYWESSDPRSTYQPAPADGTKARAGGPTVIPMGPSH
jgi:hypothetical protein